MIGVFRYANPPTIYWGARSIDKLHDECQRLGIQRPFVVTTQSITKNGVLTRVLKALDAELAVEPALVGQHAPQADVDHAVERARAAQADGVLSVGGGSPIDAAKIVALELGAKPHIAVPTTLSVAELAPSAGVTDVSGQKGGKRDARLTPSAVIYDAELALHTPIELWLSTGIRALDHAVETILEPGEHPYPDTLALEGIRRLFASLPRTKARPGVLDLRTENQLGAWFSYSLPKAAGGLSHMLGKQIGSPFGIPHGVTSCLLLPHVMRYRARAQADRLALMAPAMGVGRNGASADELASAGADAVYGLIRRLGLPQHLAAYRLTDDQLRSAAAPLAGKDHSLEDLLAIYRAAA
ncbi:MAG TPA: iron-containing alcohol dehydrogenase [Chloroflexota bacterium]|nr:iron-containing alcohol dehydrogenase [Chloroflexota bacterium]